MESDHAPRPTRPGAPISLAIDAPAGCTELAELGDSITGSGGADLETVNALARLHLVARRRGGRLRIIECSEELHELLALVGLCRVIGPCGEASPPA
jgi:hypothetical protein